MQIPLQPPHVFTIPSRVGHQTKDQLWLASSVGKGKICFACFNFQDKVYHQKCNLIASNPTSKKRVVSKIYVVQLCFRHQILHQSRWPKQVTIEKKNDLFARLNQQFISNILHSVGCEQTPSPHCVKEFFFWIKSRIK